MGKIVNNTITGSFSGQYSEDLIFRWVGNRTYFVRKGINDTPASEAQTENRNRFTEAQLVTRHLLKDPDVEEWYASMAQLNGFNSALTAAVKDYLCLPEIKSIVTKKYKGKPGDVIIIHPWILTKIRRMEITIYGADGLVLESGAATKTQLHWKYAATTHNPFREGSRIEVTAYDRFEKVGTIAKGLSR
jgi:hypothetical protein